MPRINFVLPAEIHLLRCGDGPVSFTVPSPHTPPSLLRSKAQCGTWITNEEEKPAIRRRSSSEHESHTRE
ncbi:hypothetical protein KIN20_026500 [Parelaphostrongylus tenuis]|uniref:Uncharacterized protein n=1 Tax=Parelaphostrongylus tenuis TaxID=148309 RepID=A0AAD5WCX3_PARTN|nr:hypothetical protein KIN20_026500 [Parelaphostrongylus tenuis]